METVMIVLILLQIKHWYMDFVDQTQEELEYKGVYLDWRGMKHSVKHGVLTAMVLTPFMSWQLAFCVGMLDIVLHYHVDWYKMNHGNLDIKTNQFWNHLGLDQMVHHLCYIMYVWLVI